MDTNKQAFLDWLNEELDNSEGEVNDAQNRLADAEYRFEEIEKAITIVRGLIGQHVVLESAAVVSDRATVERYVRVNAARTLGDAAEIVLRHAGRPLKNRDVAERMLKGGYEYGGDLGKLRNVLGITLNRKAKGGDTFKWVSPGTFTLLEQEEPPETAGTASGGQGSPTPSTGR